ncbi:MAG TPA: hypothetical protein VFE91_02200 [Nitrososphaerales archaeon]|nr:hypothetical protein [Nitrososphaerales archaeon]
MKIVARRSVVTAVLSGFLLLLMLIVYFGGYQASAHSSVPTVNYFAVGDTSIDVTYTVDLSGESGLLSSISHQVYLNISATVPQNPTGSPSRIINVDFVGDGAIAHAPVGGAYSPGAVKSIPTFAPASAVGSSQVFLFTLPNSSGTFQMSISGSLAEHSVLGESGAEIPFQFVNSTIVGAPVPTTYNLVVQVPDGMHVLSFYSFTKGESFVGKVNYQDFYLNGTQYLSTQYFVVPHGAIFANILTLLYASDSVVYYELEIGAVLLAAIAAPLWLGYAGRFTGPITRVLALVRRITPGQLLTVFVIASLLTVGISYAVGPNPNPRVYVMGTNPVPVGVVGKAIRANTTFVPIFQPGAEQNSATISTLGGFVAIVIVDPTIGNPSFGIIPYATSNPTITIAGSTHVLLLNPSSDFNTTAGELFGPNVQTVKSPSDVVKALNAITPRPNPLGLVFSERFFIYAEVVLAILSFALAFLGMAFVSAKIAEIGLTKGALGVAESLAYAFFAFAFIQMVYIASSVFLEVPLGLHSGNPQITVAGTIGLAGGGSRPRELAGILGFIFGAVTRSRLGVNFDRIAIVGTLAAALLLLLDPLTNGLIFHELVLTLTSGPSQGDAAQTFNFVGGLLFNIGNAFGSLASLWYFIQRGLVLYFAGAVVFVLAPKMQKTTGTILLLFSALLAGDGIVRVADMIPLKTMASTIPGFMAALMLIPIFLSFSLIEEVIRKRLS